MRRREDKKLPKRWSEKRNRTVLAHDDRQTPSSKSPADPELHLGVVSRRYNSNADSTSAGRTQQRRSSTRLAGKGLRASRRLAYLSQGRARVRPSASPPPFQRSLETVEARSRHREILEILLDDDVVNEKEIRHVGEAEPDLGHRQRCHLSREAELDENKCSNAYPIRDEYTVPIQLEFTWLPHVPEPEADGVRLARDGWEHLGNETECWWPKRGTKVATVGGDGCDTREGKISRLNPGGKSAGLEAAVGHQV